MNAASDLLAVNRMLNLMYCMKYSSGIDFLQQPKKQVLLMGLSGVGKTTVCRLLPRTEWFHYSVDYRIWTHQLRDELNDYLKTLALSNPLLKDLLLHDAITVEHRIEFDNLYASSLYMGMLGDSKHHGSNEKEFRDRMQRYAVAERSAMLDIPHFVQRSQRLYGYPHFLIDASGSLCEIVDPDDPDDEVLKVIDRDSLVIYIEATEEHTKELLRRQEAAPKPIYYRPDFLDAHMPGLLRHYGAKSVADILPADVGRYLYPRLLDHRIARYQRLANRYGYTISMTDILRVRCSSELLDTIATAI